MRTAHRDIRIGTLVKLDKPEPTASYLRQVIPHGFESFQFSVWQHLKDVEPRETAKAAVDAIGDRAVVSSLAIFGNPLQDEECRRDWGRMIDAARDFNCDMVCGFAGAVEGRPVPESMPRFKEVWGELMRRAEDRGVRVAFEHCDMGGTWESPKYNIAHASTAWEMIFNEVPSKNLGLEWEPCHHLGSLLDPIAQLREWVGRVFHVHGKDATVAWDVIKRYGIRGGKPWVWHRTPGFGDTNWTDVISILRQAKYRGCIDIEGWHDPVYRDDLEMTGQVRALQYLKACRGGDFVPNPT